MSYRSLLLDLEDACLARMHMIEERIATAHTSLTAAKTEGLREKFEDRLSDLRADRHIFAFALRAIRTRRKEHEAELSTR